MNMIGGCLCIKGGSIILCWSSDMIKIIDALIQDGYTLINWGIQREVVGLGFDFDCYLVIDHIENIYEQEAEKERLNNIRKVLF